MALIKHGNNALSNVTAFPSAVPTGKPVLLSTATASSSASIEFTLNSSYDISYFEFINIHSSADWDNHFDFQTSTNSGSSYNTTVTNTAFRSYHNEADTQTGLAFLGYAQAQSTAFIRLCEDTSAANDDENLSGCLQIFNPSSSTYVKHYIARTQTATAKVGQVYSLDWYGGGYFNTTSPLTNIQFKFATGNIDAGTIKMYGISA